MGGGGLATSSTFLDEQEDLSKVKGNFFAFVVIIFACLGAMMFGMDQGNFGNVQGFNSFLDQWCRNDPDFDIGVLCESEGKNGTLVDCCSIDGMGSNSDYQNQFIMWAGALITIGSALGSIIVGPITARSFGRRACIALGAFITVFGCFLASYLAFGNYWAFLAGRFITGFGVGTCCYALPMYSAEMSTPATRGAAGALFQFNCVMGGFLSTVITMYLNGDEAISWHIGILLPAFPGILLVFGIWFCPESPRYLIRVKGLEEATSALQRVREGDVSAEAMSIYESQKVEDSLPAVSWADLFKEPNLRKRVFIGAFIQAAQQLTGVNAFLSYAFTIFKSVGITDPFMFNVVFNGIMILGVCFGLMLLDKDWAFTGRRTQLLLASIMMGPTLLLAGILLIVDVANWAVMILLCLYAFGFQVAWGPIPWLYAAEIFESATREKALGVAVFVQYTFNAFIVMITPFLYQWGVAETLLVFASLNIANIFFVWFFVEETKNVPLEQVPQLFEKGGSKRSLFTKKDRDN